MSRHFAKPSLTIAQQITHLRNSGMLITDLATAEHWLSQVSYYRLSGYWYIWKDPAVTGGPSRFIAGTNFDQICSIYDFDRLLRRLVARATEHIEVALRGSWAYCLAHQGGPHGYLDASLYADRREFHDMLGKLSRDVAASSSTFIKHYRDTYDEPAMPAVWMSAEVMTFGQLSRWYSLLADPALRAAVATPFGLREELLVSIVKHIVDVRNICAHQGRLWNRGFRSPPKLPRNPLDLAQTLDTQTAGRAAGRLYNSLVLLVFLVGKVAPLSTWRDDLVAHLLTHPTQDFAAMGFPADWQTRPLWQ